jgi:hypothetical protein
VLPAKIKYLPSAAVVPAKIKYLPSAAVVPAKNFICLPHLRRRGPRQKKKKTSPPPLPMYTPKEKKIEKPKKTYL